MKISMQETAELLKEKNRYVLTAHVSPDGDAIGSLLALYLVLKQLGKEVVCLIDDELPDSFGFLPHYDVIQQPGEAKLTADALIILDCSDKERIGKVSQCCDAPTINIDHHISNVEFADYLYLNSNSAATGEILFELFHEMNAAIDEDIAVCLYTAIATDCGFFRYSNTSPETMRAGAELIACGVKPNIVSEELEKRPLTAIKSLGKVLDTLELFADNRIAVLSLSKELLDECESTEGFIDFPRNIDGVELAVMVKYADEGISRVSMRSRSIDVSKIAVDFNGGGHKKAAGCTIHSTVAEAKQAIVKAAERILGDCKE